MDRFDLVLVRNTGPAIHYPEEYRAMRGHARASGVRIFNDLAGKADMIGKGYLLDLWRSGYPVIPTVGRGEDLALLPEAQEYVVKPMFGADSVGMRFVGPDEVAAVEDDDLLIQPRVDLEYEVSFYFINHTFEYALYAPEPARRWDLTSYAPTEDDLRFAQQFIDWNGIDHGIQRVDGCRTTDGRLLLVELEDFNPYLSLDRIDGARQDAFVSHLTDALVRRAAQADRH